MNYFFLVLCLLAHAQGPTSTTLSDWPLALSPGKPNLPPEFTHEMSGIKFDKIKDFPKKWTLVSTHFRPDKLELRLIYSNEIARKALEKGTGQFPDGAELGKLTFYTGIDPKFPTSTLPTHLKRYQIMAKDSVKYKDTGGWGYAIFDRFGNAAPGDQRAAAVDCNACHSLVKERGYVFSKLLPIQPESSDDHPQFPAFNGTYPGKGLGSHNSAAGWKYRRQSARTLPDYIRRNMPGRFTFVRLLDVELVNHSEFFGTFFEIKGLLAQEAARVNGLTLAYSRGEGNLFTMAYPDALSPCKAGKRRIDTMIGYKPTRKLRFGQDPSKDTQIILLNGTACY